MITHESEETNIKESDKLTEAEAVDSPLLVPPDGGWGWVVVCSSFMAHVIAGSIVTSFGVLFMEFLHHFKGGHGETGWVGSLVAGIPLCSGPIGSVLTNKYDCRIATIVGSFIATSGFLLSLFAPNIYYLYFTFGVISGVGLGLVYVAAIVIVAHYFERRRASATGIALSGFGIGPFIFAPIAQKLLSEYGWRGAIMVEAGLLLNLCVCGALFRPLKVPKSHKKASVRLQSQKAYRNSIDEAVDEAKLPFLSKTSSQVPNAAPVLPVNKKVHSLQNTSALPIVACHQKVNLHHYASETLGPGFPQTSLQNISDSHGPIYSKGSLYTGSLPNITMYRSNHSLDVHSVSPRNRSVYSDENSCRLCKWLHCSDEIKDSFQEMLDLSLLRDPTFIWFAISNWLTGLTFNVPYIYMSDRAKLEGTHKDQAALLISVIGIANAVSRVVYGWLSDITCVNRLLLYSTTLTLCGICTGLSCLCRTYPLMILYSASFGFLIGAYVALTSVILVDLLGLTRLTSALGLLLLFQGVGTIMGPPIAGWLYDATRNYDVPFIVTGTLVGLSGFMLYFMPCIKQCSQHRESTGDKPGCAERNTITSSSGSLRVALPLRQL